MASKPFFGIRPVCLASMVPAGSARRHLRRCPLRRGLSSSSTFLRSLRSRPVTALHGSYGRSDSCPPLSWTLKFNGCSTRGQVSLIHALGLPTILSPNTCELSASPGHATHRRVEPRWLPFGNSGLRLYYAGSPSLTGRIEFSFLPHGGDSLRTGRSPPTAPHPASRRRSCHRLQVTLTWRGLSPLRPSALSGARSAGVSPAVARASCPCSSSVRERDAPATAVETAALRRESVSRFSRFRSVRMSAAC